ncbi:MAG TPA: sigma-54 dependent transcriptional regulator [Nitrospinota bacterium]|jgi:DNA-binding NtrC family response regulator|nr:sigma-54 dependent transcriptional regulator [Nitrospinota bacterium]
MVFKVLIVENNPEENFYNEVLGKYGINVLTSATPEDVFKQLDSTVSLVIFEHDGKKRNGLSFLKENRERIKDSLVVILTKKPDIKDAVSFMKEGAFDYLPKPLEEGKLDSFARFLIETKKKPVDKPKLQSVNKTEYRKIIGNSSKINEIIALCQQVARGKSTVLIQGETGTGKELIARLIHQESPRVKKPFVAVNCASFPEGLLESELFGHQKGAFTGAIEKKIGKMELADGGTILFDEISEMDIQLQAKLLRAIQEKEVDPVGSKKSLPIDVRILATTNRELKKYVDEKKFREDLYYRLNVIPIIVPPLRERKEDIPALIDYFLEKHCSENGFKKKTISDKAIEVLTGQNWPGNIRELENVIERAVIISLSNMIEVEHIFLEEKTGDLQQVKIDAGVTMAEMEKKLILKTLKEVQNNRQRAAEMLGIHVRTLRNKLNEYKNEGTV